MVCDILNDTVGGEQGINKLFDLFDTFIDTGTVTMDQYNHAVKVDNASQGFWDAEGNPTDKYNTYIEEASTAHFDAYTLKDATTLS